MHRSRLATIVVDCLGERMDEAVGFWGKALGVLADPKDKPGQRYFHFKDKVSNLDLTLQNMQGSEPPAFHIDIETDNVEAEVKRLEALGAKKKKKVKDWWVMLSPTGHTFCVIPGQFDDFSENCKTWD